METTTADVVTYATTTAYDAGGRGTSKTYPDGTTLGALAHNASGQQITQAGSITGWTERLQTHIDELAKDGFSVGDTQANMVLDLRVQPGGAASAQKIIQYAGRYNNVTVIVKEYP